MRHSSSSGLFLIFCGMFLFPLEVRAQQGSIEVYVDSHRGNPTSSGELYDPSGFTAAHAVLPVGTVLRVTNSSTGQAVDVRVNDRKGMDGRLVYISGAAGRRVGLAPGQASQGHVQVLAPSPGQRGAASANPFKEARLNAQQNMNAHRQAFQQQRQQAKVGWFQRKGALRNGMTPSAQGTVGASAGGQVNAGGRGLFGDRLFGNGSVAKQGVSNSGTPAYQYPQPNYAPNGQVVPMSAPYPQPASVPVAANSPGVVRPPADLRPVVPSSSLPVSSASPYRVQFGAFKKAKHAEEMNSGLIRSGVSTMIVQSTANQLFLVVTSHGFVSATDAQRWIDFEGARRGWSERPVVIR